MTRETVVRELGTDMAHRIGEVGLMTRITIGRCSRESSLRMTGGAVDKPMRSEQSEACLRVVKRRGAPGGGGVARRAVSRELTRDVVRRFR